MASLIIDMNS